MREFFIFALIQLAILIVVYLYRVIQGPTLIGARETEDGDGG